MGKDLLIACAVGDVKWAQLCVTKGASTHYTNSQGWSALHMAAMNSKLDCMKFLIEDLAMNVDITNGTGWTPLHLASRGKPEHSAVDCVNYLITNGADVNKVNDMGISSVHQSVSANNTQCLTALVKNGARVSCLDKRGLLPIDVAKVWGNVECSKYLQNVMWTEKKEEEDRVRKKWLLQHQQMLEEEIRKYREDKGSAKVQKAYNCWVKDKGCASPKLPYRCSVRAKSLSRLSCFKEASIPDVYRIKLSDKVLEQLPYPRAGKYNYNSSTITMHQQRVKKIQDLRKIITSRDASTQLRLRDVTTQLRDVTNYSTRLHPQNVKNKNYNTAAEHQQMQDRIAKLAEPKTRPKKRRKRKKVKVKPGVIIEPERAIKVESYFKASPPSPDLTTRSPSNLSPDSGFLEAEELVEEEITSVRFGGVRCCHGDDMCCHGDGTCCHGDVTCGNSEKHLDLLGSTLDLQKSEIQKSEISNKTVRFSENVTYDSEYNSVSFGNNFQGLRSCMKVKQFESI